MSNRESKKIDFSQSAVNGVQAGGNIKVGDISQNQIINLLRDEYANVEGIRAEYREKIEDIKNSYKGDVRAAQQHLYLDMKSSRNDTFQASQEKYIELRGAMKEHFLFAAGLKEMERKVDQGEADNEEVWANLGLHFFDKYQEDETKKRVEKIKNDLEILDALIDSLKQLLSHINPLSIESTLILNDTLIWRLSEETRDDVRSKKEEYINKRNELEENFNYVKDKCQKERDIKIYGHELKQCLKRDGYPLKSASLNLFEAHLREIELFQEDVDVIEEKLIQPYCRDNLEEYNQLYRNKLHERFPLSFDSLAEMKELKKKLGLDDFNFLRLETKRIEQELVKPFYQKNLEKYRQYYKSKLEQKGLNLSHATTAQLEDIQNSLGLKDYYFHELDLNKVERESIELVYRENIQKYEQKYKQKLDQEGFSLSPTTISELNDLEKTLGLGSFQFQNCPEPLSVKEKLIRPFYQATLPSYSKEYKRKLYQFGVGLAKNNIVELDKLRNSFGLNYSHLKSLGIQSQFTLEADLFNVEKIAKDLFYVESLQYYGQEFRREIESKGYCAEHSSNMKEFLQALGIRREDIIVIEGLVKNNWTIEHLFDKRDSEVSYWKLINLLAKHEWQNADTLTRDLVLELSNSSDKGVLDKEAIEKFPSKDIYTLDQLWVEYSQGNFGFSVQKEIFDSVDQKEQKFGEKVQWRGSTPILGRFTWKSYSEMFFNLSAPRGHLPIWGAKDRKIFADNFLHLKVWDFKESINSQSDSESSTLEMVLWDFNDTSESESSTTNILAQSLEKIFESINQFEIKKKVDKMGIDGFINQCAVLAATTGAASGFGGFTTMIVGVPFDVINNVLQQFRVTLGVIYYKKGIYKVSFSELITIVGVSIGVEVGATLTKSVMISIANKIIVRLSASAAGKAVPFLGAAIGGSVNYGFVKAIGAAVKRIDMNAYTFQAEGSASESGGH